MKAPKAPKALKFTERFKRHRFTPVQWAILKLIYKEPLDDSLITVVNPTTKSKKAYSEEEWLYREGLKRTSLHDHTVDNPSFCIQTGRQAGLTTFLLKIAAEKLISGYNVHYLTYSHSVASRAMKKVLELEGYGYLERDCSKSKREIRYDAAKGVSYYRDQGILKFDGAHGNSIRGRVTDVLILDDARFVKPEIYAHLSLYDTVIVADSSGTSIDGRSSGAFKNFFHAHDVLGIQADAWEFRPGGCGLEIMPHAKIETYQARWTPDVEATPLIEAVEKQTQALVAEFWEAVDSGQNDRAREIARTMREIKEEIDFIKSIERP